MTIAVFDIDGVVADVRHRLHYIEGRYKDWDGFFDEAPGDAPLKQGIDMVHDLAARHEIVWLTGRPAWIRHETQAWLESHDLPADDLHMRPSNDFRPARRFKLEVLARLVPRDIAAFIDDDSEVVAAARDAGLPVVFADWLPRARAMRDAQDRLGRA